MCKRIKTDSEVLTLVLKAQYVNEVFARSGAALPEPKEERPRIVLIESD